MITVAVCLLTAGTMSAVGDEGGILVTFNVFGMIIAYMVVLKEA